MLKKIFSSLDKKFSLFFFSCSLVWMLGFLLSFMFVYSYFLVSGNRESGVKILLKKFVKKKKSVWFGGSFSFFYLVLIIFFSMVLVNFWGLVPYMFGLSSQMFFVLKVALVVWGGMVLFSLVKNFFFFFCHLVPQGSPVLLSFFLSSMELVSSFIRPFTLTLRLSMKITTGHIFISLLSMGFLGCALGGNLLSVVFFSMIGFFFAFEMFVSLIQSFVFGLLLTQYMSEK